MVVKVAISNDFSDTSGYGSAAHNRHGILVVVDTDGNDGGSKI